MRTLIVEDDFTSRLLLQEMLGKYGPVHQAMNGKEAVGAFQRSVVTKQVYDLICLDIMLPKMNGQEVLLNIREMEKQMRNSVTSETKVVMTTGLKDVKNVMTAFKEQCDGYLIKPLDENKLIEILRKLELI